MFFQGSQETPSDLLTLDFWVSIILLGFLGLTKYSRGLLGRKLPVTILILEFLDSFLDLSHKPTEATIRFLTRQLWRGPGFLMRFFKSRHLASQPFV